ncbi:IS701 family transposase [Oscillatoriales cyanobacterium LEGE 11467]|uniref:IS701 family transposase n=1 Tax=Zarconia navalis LEGE 11467 TaxID=1828826 RepID=A0A928Z9V3_9CYAN|nr:IS701 family transposase [Zarconia navalis]MBE9041126.1 IS701 family transposase [Zarconia navalis LEGE 11467]
MDVELQVIQHLARDAQKTIPLVDEYCRDYTDIFPEVRSYECFKYLHLGIVSGIKRKSLPEIAKAVGVKSSQSLHHFLAKSPWSVGEVKKRRLGKIRTALGEREITVVIDETGDRKKGKRTDYVARQYLGSVGKIDRGIVSVNAYGVYKNITFPLTFKVFKPKGTLKETEGYQTKTELASQLIEEIRECGFKINLVLADSLYGESSTFIQALDKHQLTWVLAIRSNHGVLMPSGERVRANRWCKFERRFSSGTSETRYVREIIFGKRKNRTYWELTTDPETLPPNSTSFVMTNVSGTLHQIKQKVGNLYGLRTWVEYGFRQCKQELGWTDYRFTKFEQIERWWEIIFSAYLMVSLRTQPFAEIHQLSQPKTIKKTAINELLPSEWNSERAWKNSLNNIRLLMRPLISLWLISPWLEVFPNYSLLMGFHRLIQSVMRLHHHFSSA